MGTGGAGTDGREYPWGEEFNPAFANTDESDPEKRNGIGTTAVCTYPQGISPVGAWDMGGNVWEWVAEPGDLRGGSWVYVHRLARCACRFRSLPDYDYDFIGLRVVLSLVGSGF